MLLSARLLLLALTPLGAFMASAQAPVQGTAPNTPAQAAEAREPLTPPSAAPNEMNLYAVVTPKSGLPVGGLKASDFTLLDNNVPQPITGFRAVPQDAPVEIVLIVDAVNAGVESVAYERQQLDKLFKANDGVLPHPISLAVFTDQGIQVQGGSTSDGKVLMQALDPIATGVRIIGRSTGFYGAEERLQLSLNALRTLGNREAQKPGRKLMIWVSPGWPLLSGVGVDLSSRQQQAIFAEIVGLSTALRQSGITLYSVDPRGNAAPLQSRVYYENFTKGISKPNQTDQGDLALQVLATQTGGLVLNGGNDISVLIDRCIRDAAPYYQVSFRPAAAEHANEFHKIELRVNQPGLIARTRNGYYAQP
jgi:VWFA-related protein